MVRSFHTSESHGLIADHTGATVNRVGVKSSQGGIGFGTKHEETAKEIHHPCMTGQPLLQRLPPTRFGIGVVGGAQYANEYLRLAHFAMLRIVHRHGAAAVIHKTLLAEPMSLTHRAFLASSPTHKQGAELRVAVTTSRMLCNVFFSQQLQVMSLRFNS